MTDEVGRKVTMTLTRTTILGKAISLVALVGLVRAFLWVGLRPVLVSTAGVCVRELRPMVQGVGTVEAKLVLRSPLKSLGGLAQ
jgi:hypothetical protein